VRCCLWVFACVNAKLAQIGLMNIWIQTIPFISRKWALGHQGFDETIWNGYCQGCGSEFKRRLFSGLVQRAQPAPSRPYKGFFWSFIQHLMCLIPRRGGLVGRVPDLPKLNNRYSYSLHWFESKGHWHPSRLEPMMIGKPGKNWRNIPSSIEHGLLENLSFSSMISPFKWSFDYVVRRFPS
jgi:hypothetical protein